MMKSIAAEDIIKTVEDHCEAKGIAVPAEFRGDLQAALGEDKFSAFAHVRRDLCKRVQAVLADETMSERYGEWVAQIADGVRLRLFEQLGMEEYLTKDYADVACNPRAFVTEFLGALKPRKEWTLSDLEQWESAKGVSGQTVVTRLGSNFCTWNEDLVALVVGKENRSLLDEHPFKYLKRQVQSKFEARRYLKEFLAQWPEGKSWKPNDVEAWTSTTGVDGENVVKWVRKNMEGGVTESNIRTVLGQEAGTHLLRHPFQKRETVLNTPEQAKEALQSFLKSRPKGVWHLKDLQDWIGSTGATGEAIYKHVWKTYGEFTVKTLRQFLGKNARLLKERPFEKEEKRLKNPAKARAYLAVFLESLPTGSSWSAVDLRSQEKIGKEGPSGSALYTWLLSFLDDLNEVTLRTFLKEKATLLDRHPFAARRIRRLTDEQSAKKYLLAFLGSLPEGETWSATTLQETDTIDGEVQGEALYAWIRKNYPRGFTLENIKKILGDQEDVLKAHPFQVKRRRVKSQQRSK